MASGCLPSAIMPCNIMTGLTSADPESPPPPSARQFQRLARSMPGSRSGPDDRHRCLFAAKAREDISSEVRIVKEIVGPVHLLPILSTDKWAERSLDNLARGKGRNAKQRDTRNICRQKINILFFKNYKAQNNNFRFST
jgi:hypothetical protein